MNEPTNIERVVMRRVRTISVLRPLFSGGALAALILLLALWGIGREVWVAKVFANGPQDFFGQARYFGYAFEHTRLVVQALSLAVLAAGLYRARSAAELAVTTFVPARP